MDDQETLEIAGAPPEGEQTLIDVGSSDVGVGAGGGAGGGAVSEPGSESGTSGRGPGRIILIAALAIALLIVLGGIFAVAIYAGSAPDDAPAQQDPNLVGKLWQWYAYSDPVVGQTDVPNPAAYTITFNEDGTLALLADCNSGGGVYTLNGSNINIGITQLTSAACPPGSLGNRFASLLNDVTLYSFLSGDLLLELPADRGTMQLSQNPPAAPPTLPAPQTDPALIGPAWKWFAASNPATGPSSVPNPDNYSLTFAPDGTVAVQADCNRAAGSYSADGSNIDITIGPMTLAACPPGSLGDSFVQQLNDAVIYAFEGDVLRMELPADAGSLQLSANPPATVDPGLTGRLWKWFASSDPVSGSSTIANPDEYTVQFNDNGTVDVRADCNSGGGTYAANAGNIDINILQVTRAACPPGSLGDQFVNQLNQAVVYSFEGDTLLLDLPADAGTLQLAENPPAPPANLVGTIWQWTLNNDPAAGAQAIANPESYTVAFNEDGTVSIVADCNTGGGNYTLNGSLIAIAVTNVTAADCGPESLSNAFIARLNVAYEYFFQGASLIINLRGDSGSMGFNAAP